jgi:hypothetical protein
MSNIKTADDLEALSHSQLLELFSELEAPAISEMHGEYAARLLAQPNLLSKLMGAAVVHNPFQQWQCKAFRPIDAHSGRGYNTFTRRGRLIQRYPMGTQLAPSRFDGKPAYQLVYRHFHSTCASIYMVDEVRRAAEGIYLGLGTYGLTQSQRAIPYPFILVRSQNSYRGDIGRPRKNFQPGAREIPALYSK